MIDLGFGREQFQEETGVSSEIANMYEVWFSLLKRWNTKINLVSPRTLDSFWSRHALDSHQIFSALPKQVKTIIDLGAGAGFPGLALAIMMREIPDTQITLVESNGKKCNFLRTVIRELKLPANAKQARAEEIEATPFDVVTARAFAPLPRLFSYAQPFWREGTVGVFPKGESWESEIKIAEVEWQFEYTTRPSLTDDRSRILMIKGLRGSEEKNYGGESVGQKSA